QLAEFFGVKDGKGVLVASVNDNSVAARAGLKAGDVITAVDDQKVDGINALVTALAKKEGAVTLKIIRNRAEQSVTVTLEKRSEMLPLRRPHDGQGDEVCVIHRRRTIERRGARGAPLFLFESPGTNEPSCARR